MEKSANKLVSDLKVKDVEEDLQENETLVKDGGSKRTDQEWDPSEESDVHELLDDPMDNVPPDFELAKRHRDANRVKNIMEEEGQGGGMYENEDGFWECCQMPTSMVAPPFKICTSIFNLEDLGCGFPLYFEFKKFIFLTFLIMICVFSFAALVFNSNEDRADQ